MKIIIRILIILSIIIAAEFSGNGILDNQTDLTQAQARIGRPLTPLSIAGVARRTTRRTIRRTAIYRNSLPRGCQSIFIDGISVYQCGSQYYQSYGNQYVIININ